MCSWAQVLVKRSPTLGALVSTKTKCIKLIFTGKIILVPLAFLISLSIYPENFNTKFWVVLKILQVILCIHRVRKAPQWSRAGCDISLFKRIVCVHSLITCLQLKKMSVMYESAHDAITFHLLKMSSISEHNQKQFWIFAQGTFFKGYFMENIGDFTELHNEKN